MDKRRKELSDTVREDTEEIRELNREVRDLYDRIKTLKKAVRLVLSLHDKPSQNVPGFLVKLDPKAEEQLRAAVGEHRAAEKAATVPTA